MRARDSQPTPTDPADEPTGELDSSTAREILTIFRRIVSEEQVTILDDFPRSAEWDDYVDTIYRLRAMDRSLE